MFSRKLYTDFWRKKDCDVTLLTLDGADHADIQFFQDEVWNRIAEFFHEKLK